MLGSVEVGLHITETDVGGGETGGDEKCWVLSRESMKNCRVNNVIFVCWESRKTTGKRQENKIELQVILT